MSAALCWALVLAATLNLDRMALGQNAISRPLIAGLIIGLLVGQERLGLKLGLWTELIWLARSPSDSYNPPNGYLAVSAALVGLAGSLAILGEPLDPEKPLAPLALILIVPLAYASVVVERENMKWSNRVLKRLSKALEDDQPLKLFQVNLKAIGLTFFLALALALLGAVSIAIVMMIALTIFPAWIWLVFKNIEPLIPILCVAFMVMDFDNRELRLFFLKTTAVFLLFSLILFW
jgi:mannose/fructose/N-acetylgalactosamine-specific phosphotransferase system component IIC